jgi:hypothetical protein
MTRVRQLLTEMHSARFDLKVTRLNRPRVGKGQSKDRWDTHRDTVRVLRSRVEDLQVEYQHVVNALERVMTDVEEDLDALEATGLGSWGTSSA